MKNIAIFGATGMTGLCVLKEALNRGFNVRALIRDPSKLPSEFIGKISIVQGDVLDAEKVEEALKGQNAVIVTLGTREDLNPTTVMSEGLKNILSAMKMLNISVITVCLSFFVFRENPEIPNIYHDINEEHKRMEMLLRASDLNWIAACPPYITDDEPSGYITTWNKAASGNAISKNDLAKFFVDCLVEPRHYKKSVGLSSVTAKDKN